MVHSAATAHSRAEANLLIPAFCLPSKVFDDPADGWIELDRANEKLQASALVFEVYCAECQVGPSFGATALPCIKKPPGGRTR
jgi:hypothetical protein